MTRANLFQNSASLYRLALACGVLPLVAGVSILAAYAATEYSGLIVAGFGCLCGGAISFTIGAAAIFVWRSRTRTGDKRSIPWLPVMVLAANLPAAAACIVAGGLLATEYVVVIRNDTPVSIDAIKLTGGGCDKSYGSLLPGDELRAWLWFDRDGELELTFAKDGERNSMIIEGYVTSNGAGKKLVEFRSDGSMDIDGERAPLQRIRSRSNCRSLPPEEVAR